MSVRSVQIGKGRRITIDEVISVVVSRDGRLELFQQTETPVETTSAVTFDPSKLDVTDTTELLSEEASLTVLTLLSLAVAQCRLLPGASPEEESLDLAHGLLTLTHSSSPVRLPSDPTLLVASLASTSTSRTLPPVSVVSRIVPLAQAVLAAGRARYLVEAADCVAALSAERLNLDVSRCFSDTLFDTLRPHRGCITTANSLRAVLQGSQYAQTVVATKKKALTLTPTVVEPVTVSNDDVAAVRTTPQYHGPARESVLAACKTLELELNCSEPDSNSTLDDTVVRLTSQSLNHAVRTLLEGSLKRSGKDVLVNTNDDVEETARLLQLALEEEAALSADYVHGETLRVQAEAKKKEEEKAKRAALLQNKPNTNNDGGKDEFAGMSEAKKAKILKKRADNEAKAAAKKAAKHKAAANSSAFGMGTGPLVTLLRTHDHALTPAVVSAMTALLQKLLSGGVQRKPKIAKGTRDYLPAQMKIRQQAFAIIRRVFQSHGAVEIDTPVFELKETLTGKYGEDSKLIYDLADQGGESLALRYDLTVPFARFLALNPVGNIKRFHIGKVYRRDKPVLSKGRYREFYQCDFDVAGSYGRMVPDSECLCVACEILDGLPLGVDFAIKLNHRRLLDAILDLCGVHADKFRTICSAVDKLDKEPWEEVRREMVVDKGLKPEVADKIGTFVLQKGEPWEMYHKLMGTNNVEGGGASQFAGHEGATTAMEDLRILFEYLEAMDKLRFISFDLSLARGLDYYTGVIYEAVCISKDTQVGSIGGGGRYDNLVSMFQEAGKVTPCVGVSVGIERVFTLMENHLRSEQQKQEDGAAGTSSHKPDVDVLIASAGASMMCDKMKIARVLWDAKISAEFSQAENVKLKNEITNALDRDIPFMVVVGEEEAKENKCKVKDLKNRTEELVSVDDLVKILLQDKGVVPVGCEFAKEFMDKLSTK